MSEDPLLELVVDAIEVDRQRIAEALKNLIGVDKSGRVVLQAGFRSLSSDQKLLAFLLGRKAAVLLDFADDEAIGPGELSKQTGMPEGTVRPKIRSLLSNRYVSQNTDKGYYLSPHQVLTAIEQLGTDSSEGTEPVSPHKRSSRPRRSKASRTPGTETESNGREQVAGESARKTTNAQRNSTTDIIRKLIEAGFFDEPKTLSDVKAHIKDKQGRSIKVTTLSPVFTRLLRDRTFDRAKNDDGVYEYHTIKGAG